MQNLATLPLVLLLLASCSPNDKSSNGESDSVDSVTNVQDSARREIRSDSSLDLTFLKGNFRISSTKYSSSYPSSETYTSMCLDWKLSEEQIRLILSNSTHLNPSDWHHLYDHLNCSIEVGVISNLDTLEIAINGGSFLFLRMENSTILLSDTLQEHEAFFLSSPITVDEME